MDNQRVVYLLEALANNDMRHTINILESMERVERKLLKLRLGVIVQFMNEYEDARDTALKFPAKNEE